MAALQVTTNAKYYKERTPKLIENNMKNLMLGTDQQILWDWPRINEKCINIKESKYE